MTDEDCIDQCKSDFMDNYNKSMNFLILGSDQPDKEHPPLKNSYLRFTPDSGVSSVDWEITALKYRFSDEGMKTMEDLRCFYKDKVKALKVCFDAHLSGYGSMEIPLSGLSVWLEFFELREITDGVEMLRDFGVYAKERNPFFKPEQSVLVLVVRDWRFGIRFSESYRFVLKNHDFL